MRAGDVLEGFCIDCCLSTMCETDTFLKKKYMDFSCSFRSVDVLYARCTKSAI